MWRNLIKYIVNYIVSSNGSGLLELNSDNDGLSDADEDGLSDGDEILLGLNPLVQKTDGTTLDSKRTFTQELSENNISEELLPADNAAISRCY